MNSLIVSPWAVRVRAGVAVVSVAAAIAWAAACASSGSRPARDRPGDARAGAARDSAPPVNAVNPLGTFFENRLALGLADTQVAKLEKVDHQFVLAARPLRRRVDSLQTVAHDWPGYRTGGAVDTARLPAPARDSVFRLRDAVAGAQADLHVLARHARSQALDVLSIEQLERMARMSGPVTAADYRAGGRRPTGGGGYTQAPPTTSVVRAGGVVVPASRDPLRGITLTDAQRMTIDSIRAAFHAEARDLGDPSPAIAAPLRDVARRQWDAVRAILTPEQQAVFDRNRNPLGPRAAEGRADSARADSTRIDAPRDHIHPADSAHTDTTRTPGHP